MSAVSIVKCRDYEAKCLKAALKQTFDNLGGVEKFIKPGMKVALKPNLLMKKKPDGAVTTHPALVKEVVNIIHAAGATVVIADSPAGLYTESALKGIYSACGMEEVAAQTGAKLNYDLSEVTVDNPLGKYLKKVNVIKPLVDADLVINLPKLKTHVQMVYTGAVKNLFGAIPGAQKPEYHMRFPDYADFANVLVDIFLSVKPALNIMDAVVGMEGHGPSGGDPRKIGLILAGESAFELDMTALAIIGASPRNVPVIWNAVERGLCPPDMDGISCVGENVKQVKMENFIMPDLGSLKAIQFVNGRVLKRCMAILRPKPVFDYNVCAGCSDCARNCPAGIIEMRNKKPQLELSKCIRCFCCQETCPVKAIAVKKPFFAGFVINTLASVVTWFRNRKNKD